MGKGSEHILEDSSSRSTDGNLTQLDKLTVYSWAEIRKHNKKADCWVVVNGIVYDVTKFQQKHPGGNRLLNFYGGLDATVRTIHHRIK